MRCIAIFLTIFSANIDAQTKTDLHPSLTNSISNEAKYEVLEKISLRKNPKSLVNSEKKVQLERSIPSTMLHSGLQPHPLKLTKNLKAPKPVSKNTDSKFSTEQAQMKAYQQLGSFYETGTGVEQDLEKSSQYFKSASEMKRELDLFKSK